MYKGIITALVLLVTPLTLILSGEMIKTTEPVTADSSLESPVAENEPTILTLFVSEKDLDLSKLIIKRSDGTAFHPVISDVTGQPIYGAYQLSLGTYHFSFNSSNSKDEKEATAFVISELSESVVVPLESPADILYVEEFSEVSVNPVYRGTVDDSSIKPRIQSIDDRVKALYDLYSDLNNKNLSQ